MDCTSRMSERIDKLCQKFKFKNLPISEIDHLKRRIGSQFEKAFDIKMSSTEVPFWFEGLEEQDKIKCKKALSDTLKAHQTEQINKKICT
eukprot:UN32411